MSLRVAVLGYGWAANRHVQAARELGGDVVDIVGVAGHDGGRAAAFAERHGVRRSTDDWISMVASPDVDAVVIATPNALHDTQAMAALSAGKDVLVEKPLAMTVARAEAMIEVATAADRILAVGHMWRYRDEVVALRRQVEAGDLGRIVRTHGYGVHAEWGPSGWFVEPALSGGGALIDMGIHAIDTARYLLGDPQPVRVQASIGFGQFQESNIDDDGLIIVDWEGGTRSLIEFGWWQPVLGGLEAETELFGTGGFAQIWPNRVPTAEGYDHCSVPMYARQLADFASCCSTRGTPTASASGGLTALRVVEFAYAAAAR